MKSVIANIADVEPSYHPLGFIHFELSEFRRPYRRAGAFGSISGMTSPHTTTVSG